MSFLFINANQSVGTINKNIYGQFSEHLGRCIYGGVANRDGGLRADVVAALKALDVPVLRWPGGCFADTYHWRDGIGPKENRKTIVNTNWGGVTEDNTFGTHEFMELCRAIGCEPYFSGNVGSGTVQEFSDWVEYCNMPGVSPMADLRRENGAESPFNVRYWGIGNEAWGCGGNMRAEYYADLCRQYATFLRGYDPAVPLYKIASGASEDDYHWTRAVVELAGHTIDAVSMHYYTRPLAEWHHKGAATGFPREEYFSTLHKTLFMEELVENHGRVIRQFAKGKAIGLVVDEWGTWFDVEPGTNPGFLYQQNAMRDALVAAINLNIFNNHCDTVVMANIAQVVNVLQAMILTEGDKMLLTPTYHVFCDVQTPTRTPGSLKAISRPRPWSRRSLRCRTCTSRPAARRTTKSSSPSQTSAIPSRPRSPAASAGQSRRLSAPRCSPARRTRTTPLKRRRRLRPVRSLPSSAKAASPPRCPRAASQLSRWRRCEEGGAAADPPQFPTPNSS